MPTLIKELKYELYLTGIVYIYFSQSTLKK
jgi:hypothetical protein